MKQRLLWMLLCIPLGVFAQSDGSYRNDLNYAPTTPEVSSLGKFIETPVSLYSGIPNVSVPIGAVTDGPLSIPVSLSYHAGGIKVEEIASWAGLGWNLSAGGSVTRVVRGIADDAVGGFLTNSHTVQDFIDTPKTPENNGLLWDIANRAAAGELDYEPDMYHYNFPGASGSFFMTQTGEILVTPYTDILIEPVKDRLNKITGWIFTTTDGTKSYFGISKDGTRTGYEAILSTVTLGGGKNHSNGYTNGWKLMDIEDYTGQHRIELSYTQDTYDTCSATGQQRFVNTQGSGPFSTGGIRPISYYESVISSAKIASITSSNGRIDFIKDTVERLDQPGDYRLKEIRIKDSFNTLIKTFQLTHNQVNNSFTGHTVPCSGNERYYRMFLSSVQEIGGNASIPPYRFTYNSKALPDRYSYAKDFWGYYNGKHNNTHLIPSVTVKGVRYQGADKTADATFGIAGTLERVTYPTGGYTDFTYEGNTISQLAFAQDIAPRTQHTIVSANTSDVNAINAFEKPFTLANNEYIQNIVYADVNYPCDISDRTCGITIEIRKSDGSIPAISLPVDTSLTLNPGDYVLSGRILEDDDGNLPDFSIRLYGEKLDLGSLTTDGVNFEVGGLRIANIKKYDTPNSYFEKSYTYTSFYGNTNSSSGALTSTPFFVEEGAVYANGDNGADTSYDGADIISSSSNNPMTTTKSSYVGYSNVTEYYGNNTTNMGKKEYEFAFALDDDSNVETYPFAPRTTLEWLRGNLKEERAFKKEDDGSYTRISRTINNYTYHRDQNSLFKESVTGIKLGTRGYFYLWNYYPTIREWYHLENTVTTQYYNGREVTTTKQVQYHNDENKHIFPVRETTTTSDGSTLITQTQYPEDLSTKTPAEQKLIDQYRIATPIQVTSTRKEGTDPEIPISKVYNVYKDWGNNLLLPQFIKTLKGTESSTNPLQDRMQYHRYDNKGNPVEVSLPDGTHIVYIWGYNQQHPIAKIENATYSQVTTYVANLQNKSDADNDRTQGYTGNEGTLRQDLDALRTNLPDAMISTYTYDPLIGVTSMTDPRGYTMYYQYDDLNRLEFVKDQDGNLVSENRYHYKN